MIPPHALIYTNRPKGNIKSDVSPTAKEGLIRNDGHTAAGTGRPARRRRQCQEQARGPFRINPVGLSRFGGCALGSTGCRMGIESSPAGPKVRDRRGVTNGNQPCGGSTGRVWARRNGAGRTDPVHEHPLWGVFYRSFRTHARPLRRAGWNQWPGAGWESSAVGEELGRSAAGGARIRGQAAGPAARGRITATRYKVGSPQAGQR
jgi:hypothetical protein